MTRYAQKWKRAEIYKRKSAGRLQEKRKHDCGTPPPQGEVQDNTRKYDWTYMCEHRVAL